MALALYHPEHGFYATGGQAGRRGDFLTSPEVGPLFGAVVARALDGWWAERASPTCSPSSRPAPARDRWRGRCSRSAPCCRRALRYVLVELSERPASAATPSTSSCSRPRSRSPALPILTRTTSAAVVADRSDRREPRRPAEVHGAVRRAGQRAARQPARPALRAHRRRVGRGAGRHRRRAPRRRRRAAVVGPPGHRRAARRPRARSPAAASRWVREARRAGRSRRAASSRSTTRRRPTSWPDRPWTELAAHLPRPRAAAAIRSSSSASRTSPARWPSTSCPTPARDREPGGVAARARHRRAGGRRPPRSGASGPRSATSRP